MNVVPLIELLSLTQVELCLLAYDEYPACYDRLTADSTRAELINEIMGEWGYRWPTAGQTNPFGDRGCIRQLERYLVRQPLTRQLLDQLGHGNSVALVGASQTGKSSLLHYLQQQGMALLSQPNLSIVSLDLQAVETEADFYEDLYEALHLEQTIQPHRLMRHLRRTDRRIILCLDEVERLTKLDEFVRSRLRIMIDGTDTPMSLVTASRTPLRHLFPDEQSQTSPLYNLCHQLEVQHFSLAETLALMQQRLPRGCTLPPTEVAQAWQTTQGHPMQVQQALRHLFNRVVKSR